MSTCPRCKKEFDPENETQPYCECGYSFIEDYSNEDRLKNVEEDATEYYDQMFKKAEEENLLIDKEIEILKTILSELKDTADFSKLKILEIIENISNLYDSEISTFNKILASLSTLPNSSYQKLMHLTKDFYGLEEKPKDEEPQF